MYILGKNVIPLVIANLNFCEEYAWFFLIDHHSLTECLLPSR